MVERLLLFSTSDGLFSPSGAGHLAIAVTLRFQTRSNLIGLK